MIFDILENHPRYSCLGELFTTSFLFLQNTDLSSIKPGRIDLLGDRLYVLVQEFISKPMDQGFWEAHRRYIDLQYVHLGNERMGFAQLRTMHSGTYISDRDFLPITGSGNMVDVFAGAFVVFYPEDAHMPCLAVDSPEMVKKIVFKIRI